MAPIALNNRPADPPPLRLTVEQTVTVIAKTRPQRAS